MKHIRDEPFEICAPFVRLNQSRTNITLHETPLATLVQVDGSTPNKSVKQGLERVARMFRREFHYDFVQYHAHDDGDPRDRLLLWIGDRDYDPKTGNMLPRVLGGACLVWREWNNHPHGHSLTFVWIHPFKRRHGMLTAAWPVIEKIASPGFHIEPPYSPGMLAFLRKRYPGRFDKGVVTP